MVSFITIPAVTLHGMTAFPCHNLGGKRRLVSGYFKQGTTATAADKMMKVLEAESAAGGKAAHAI